MRIPAPNNLARAMHDVLVSECRVAASP